MWLLTHGDHRIAIITGEIATDANVGIPPVDCEGRELEQSTAIGQRIDNSEELRVDGEDVR